MSAIEPRQFVQLVEPLLAKQDLTGLLNLLKTRWSPDQLRDLLRSEHVDAKKVALLAMALVGPSCCVEELSLQLRDPDPVINQLAEHALWAIWFRSGKCQQANQMVCRGAEALDSKDFDGAIELFNQAIRTDPDFAEAYNQRAIAYYLMEDYPKSVADCRRAILRMPCHFGAWSGSGHCHAHLNEIPQAMECYEKALSINPHLACVRETVEELRKQL
ncbi:MAG: tetratricopeptide repeat protein [Tepidisphaeraceae bacterium]